MLQKQRTQLKRKKQTVSQQMCFITLETNYAFMCKTPIYRLQTPLNENSVITLANNI